MKRHQNVLLAISLALPIAVVESPALAAEITVLCSNGLVSIMQDLVPRFESASGNKVAITFMGVDLKPAIENGRQFDLAISQPDVIESLINAGKITSGTNVAVIRQGMGVAARADAIVPDISSTDAFRKAMLNAKSVAYPSDGASGVYTASVFARMGIANEMKPKTVLMEAAKLLQPIIDGDVQLGLTVVGRIVGDKRLQYVGPYPAELQKYFVLMGGISSTAKVPLEAKEMLGFLSSPDATAAINARGMEQIAVR
jgi:molybdate transport system substrate-binding protein